MAAISSVLGGNEASLKRQMAVVRAQPATPVATPALRSAPIPRHVPEQAARPTRNELQIPTLDEVQNLVDEVQQAIDAASRDPFFVAFRPSDDNSTFVLELRNSEGELIRQFPPEKVLNLRDKLDELSGMVIDEVI